MQQKRKFSRPVVLLMATLGMTVGVVVVLLAKDVKAPQQMIEKELDAGAFAQSGR